MRIFLSYSSKNLAAAEGVKLRLEQDEHEVFFVREDLPAGDEFDTNIRESIARCDLFVFLISPDSVASGSYCRSELKLAKERWRHPAGHVLPVMLVGTPLDQVPEYLKAVTILQPEGNTAAEVSAAVARLAERSRLRIIKRVAVPAIAILVLLVVGLTMVLRKHGGPSVIELTREKQGLLGEGDSYVAKVDLGSGRGSPSELSDLNVEAGTDEFTIEASPLGTPLSAQRRHRLRLVWKQAGHPEASLAENQLPSPAQWRLAWMADGKRHAGELMAWKPQGSFAPAPVSPLATNLFARVRTVAACGQGFCLGLAEPNQAVLLSFDGQRILRQEPLPGVPVAADFDGESIYLATETLNAVIRIAAPDFGVAERVPIKQLSVREFDEVVQLSTLPASMVATKTEVWLMTSKKGGRPGLLRRPTGGAWEVPAYTNYSDLLSDFDSIRLWNVNGRALGVSSSSPHYTYDFTPASWVSYSGHDYMESIGSFASLAAATNGNAAGLGSDFQVMEVALREGSVEIVRRGRALGVGFPGMEWDTDCLVSTDHGYLAGMTRSQRGENYQVLESCVLLIGEGEPVELLRRHAAEVVAMAAHGDSAVVVLRRQNLACESYFIRLK